ncbi:LicD family protein [Candidatus Saccharibacteria bacterium]|nr:LicD family protein [Candidatus Saccharibacteria bacterium]
MKKINKPEYNEVLVGILTYLDYICRKNNIKYTLVGGTLIGAIRHRGIIPWDDDIDIALMPDQYKKLIKALKQDDNKQFKLFNPEENSDYLYPFAKLIDTRTLLREKEIKQTSGYGIYVDIFQYHNAPKTKLVRILHYRHIQFYKMMIATCMLSCDSRKSIKRTIRKIIAKILTTEGIKKKYIKINKKYDSKPTEYVLINWPAYGHAKDYMRAEWFKKYTNTLFENHNFMISSEYDKILRTTFDDYMKLPPKEKRKSNHNIEAYWI